ncbi:protein kinase [Candidatus Woesearchaeota archaeon]|nr:protein kinase [Candidatus Woesearchaeota archaeon]
MSAIPDLERTFAEQAIRELHERGYQIGAYLGEGHTRKVYKGKYRRGLVERDVVIKIPKETDNDSLTTRINFSGKNLDNREVQVLNGAVFSRVVTIFDTISLGDRSITVEEYFEGESLEERIKKHGPLKKEEFERYFGQVIEGLRELHLRDIVHRDIKPSNILVSKGDLDSVKLCDLQNARIIFTNGDLMLPTKGGTAYASPGVLNRLMAGQPLEYDYSDEMYALGGTMYFALTGEQLFNRTLEVGDSERVFSINGEEVGGVLKEGGIQINKIDWKEHDKLLNRRLKKIPRGYRDLIFQLMCTENNNYQIRGRENWYTHIKLNEDFKKATRKLEVKVRDLMSGIKVYMGVAGVITGVLGGVYAMHLQQRNDRYEEMTIRDVLTRKNTFLDQPLEEILDGEDPEMLQGYFATIKRAETALLQIYTTTPVQNAKRGTDISGVSERLAQSVAISLIFNDDARARELYKDKAIGPAFLRRDYVEAVGRLDLDGIRDHLFIGHVLRYCLMGGAEDITDVFACYFLDNEDKFAAQMQAGSRYFFPQEGLDGYGDYLDPKQRDLIGMATALYLITDQGDVEVHTEIINSDGTINQGYLDTEYNLRDWLRYKD